MQIPPPCQRGLACISGIIFAILLYHPGHLLSKPRFLDFFQILHFYRDNFILISNNLFQSQTIYIYERIYIVRCV